MRPDLWHRRGPSSERRGLTRDPHRQLFTRPLRAYLVPPAIRPKPCHDRCPVRADSPNYAPTHEPRRLQPPLLRPPPSGPHTCTQGSGPFACDGSTGSWRSAGTRYGALMAMPVDITIVLESPDEDGWIVARVLEVAGALSQGRTRDEACQNALDALNVILAPDEELHDAALGREFKP